MGVKNRAIILSEAEQNNLSFSNFSINLERKTKESFKNNKVFGSLHDKFFYPSIRRFTFFMYKEIKSFLSFNTF